MTSLGVLRLPKELRSDIDACGYFPDMVADAMALVLGEEEVQAHLVHHEATFSHEEVSRHLTVLVLTASRLLVAHTDENDGHAGEPPQAITTTESVPLGRLNSVSLTSVVANPDKYRSARTSATETWLNVGWGTNSRVDLEPAHCGDPGCEADHGYSGTMAADDLTVRMSVTADGAAKVARLVRFATALQHATGPAR